MIYECKYLRQHLTIIANTFQEIKETIVQINATMNPQKSK